LASTPTDTYASLYGAESFVYNNEITPRGSFGRTPNNWSFDLTARYDMQIQETDVTFRLDVFNVFDNDTHTEVNEVAERFAGYEGVDYGYGVIARGQPNEFYGLPTSFQAPRSVRLSAEVKF